MDINDFKVGDRVRATRNNGSGAVVEDTVTQVLRSALETKEFHLGDRYYDFWLVERPLPPVEPELVAELNGLFYEETGEASPALAEAIINAVRSWDVRAAS